MTTAPWLTIIGVGDDGIDNLPPPYRAQIDAADVIIGHHRLSGPLADTDGRFRAWDKPFEQMLGVIEQFKGQRTVLLATGDPMFHGIGASLSRRLPASEFEVWPSPSAFSLAAARMRWPIAEVVCLSLHYRDPAEIIRVIHPGARILALTRNADTATAVAQHLLASGFADARISILAHIGGADEQRFDCEVQEVSRLVIPDFYVLALECRMPNPGAWHGRGPGLPDSMFAHDGQLTKQETRAITLAALKPFPGAVLWDIGAGCGSVSVEWLRAADRTHAIAFEQDPNRQEMIVANRKNLGVPDLQLVTGQFPASVDAALPAPDALFIGGGITQPEVLDAAMAHLPPRGVLVANTVTVEGNVAAQTAQMNFGGDLVRIDIATSRSIGPLTGLAPKMSVLQWRFQREQAVS